MKTTVEIPDPLFRQAKQYAARHGLTLRELLTRGLEMALRETAPPRRRFRLKTVTTKGQGLVCEGDWSAIRSLIYEGHGA